jgi:uncharacterized membrane-anchored protein YhcB (DUF1043 family)
MITYVLIGFVCGFICRQVIWLEQKRQAGIRYRKEMEDLKKHMDKLKKDIKQSMKEIENEIR